MISRRGELIGVGSLQLERERGGKTEHANMIVPIDLLKLCSTDLRRFGEVDRPARPSLGMYSTEIDNGIVVIGVSGNGQAARAELKAGDVILSVKGEQVASRAGFYRSSGPGTRRRRRAADRASRRRHLRCRWPRPIAANAQGTAAALTVTVEPRVAR